MEGEPDFSGHAWLVLIEDEFTHVEDNQALSALLDEVEFLMNEEGRDDAFIAPATRIRRDIWRALQG